MFEKEVNKNMYLRINSSRVVYSWYFQEEFDRQKEEEQRQRKEEEQRQSEEEERRWKEYMSDLWTEEEDHPCCWKCNLIW